MAEKENGWKSGAGVIEKQRRPLLTDQQYRRRFCSGDSAVQSVKMVCVRTIEHATRAECHLVRDVIFWALCVPIPSLQRGTANGIWCKSATSVAFPTRNKNVVQISPLTVTPFTVTPRLQ